jgi:hypothetical protein
LWLPWWYEHVTSPRLFVRLRIQAWNLHLDGGSEATIQLVAKGWRTSNTHFKRSTKENPMKKLFLATCFVSAGIGLVTMAIICADQGAEKPAQEAAQSWLALVDSGKYSESWNEAAQVFKERVTREQWEAALKSVRTPLGQLESRKLKSAQFTRELPGAPDGEYVVILYDTTFQKKRASLETVTPMKDKDGQWRVSGYFIK